MEAKDLMIGDWVQVPSELNRYKRIGSTFDMDSAVLYKPIPLTPEILKKNGFKCDAHPNYVCDSYFIDGISMLDFRAGYFKYCTITIQYVHQLQHLLRLRGIDKGIEL